MAIRRIPKDITYKKVTLTLPNGMTLTYEVPDFGAARNRIRKKNKK